MNVFVEERCCRESERSNLINKKIRNDKREMSFQRVFLCTGDILERSMNYYSTSRI